MNKFVRQWMQWKLNVYILLINWLTSTVTIQHSLQELSHWSQGQLCHKNKPEKRNPQSQNLFLPTLNIACEINKYSLLVLLSMLKLYNSQTFHDIVYHAFINNIIHSTLSVCDNEGNSLFLHSEFVCQMVQESECMPLSIKIWSDK